MGGKILKEREYQSLRTFVVMGGPPLIGRIRLYAVYPSTRECTVHATVLLNAFTEDRQLDVGSSMREHCFESS